jgi:hypothetical protein
MIFEVYPMYKCVSDLYDRNCSVYDTIEDFLNMCWETYGVKISLTKHSDGSFTDGSFTDRAGNVVLISIALGDS